MAFATQLPSLCYHGKFIWNNPRNSVGGKDVYPKLKQSLLCGASRWVRKRWNGNPGNTMGLFVLTSCGAHRCSTDVKDCSLAWTFLNTDYPLISAIKCFCIWHFMCEIYSTKFKDVGAVFISPHFPWLCLSSLQNLLLFPVSCVVLENVMLCVCGYVWVHLYVLNISMS